MFSNYKHLPISIYIIIKFKRLMDSKLKTHTLNKVTKTMATKVAFDVEIEETFLYM